MAKVKKEKIEESSFAPMMVEGSTPAHGGVASRVTETRSRRNAASTIERTDRFRNIDEGMVPFNYATGYNYNKSNIDVRDTVILCQKAYYNFGLFRNTIDLLSELSCGNLHLKGGNKSARDFFQALFNKINITALQDKFFREYYRSGNVFIYRYDTAIKEEDISKISQVFGSQALAAKISLPSRYIIINPADVQVNGNLSFNRGQYYKVLTDYELEQVRNPRTEEDKEILNSLDPLVKEQILKGKSTAVLLHLDTKKFYAVFYKKQDYEPFAVPMGFPVLEDISAKIEMRRMDMALTRTIQQVVLLITMGTEPDKGGVNQENLKTMQNLFTNQSIGRVLIADYTTKAEFVIPQIADILDPRKYEVIDRDINIGLNNILVGNEKFANTTTKVSLLGQKLIQARQAFITDFLLPEIKRISKEIGFKVFPTPFFEDMDLKTDQNLNRIYTRLMELGVLTPEEGLKAIETGVLPSPEESLQSQNSFIDLKDKGLYQPLIGGPKIDAGRPAGSTGIKQTTKNVKPVGTSSKANYSVTKLKDIVEATNKLGVEVENILKKKHKLKKLNDKQKEVALDITKIIVANEEKSNWTSKISEYIDSPVDKNQKTVEEIHVIACEHQVDSYMASLLYHSKI
jgi:hypothetical protein